MAGRRGAAADRHPGRTGGNPFFIRETARLLDSEGALAATTEVPAGVREVLHRRIARLPAVAQTILRQAAVLGTETEVDVLAEVAGAEENVLLDAVEAGPPGGPAARPPHAALNQTPGAKQGISAAAEETHRNRSANRRSRLMCAPMG